MYDRSVKVDMGTPTDASLFASTITADTFSLNEEKINQKVKHSYGQLMNSGTSSMCWDWRLTRKSMAISTTFANDTTMIGG
jgi:hypothetical protein